VKFSAWIKIEQIVIAEYARCWWCWWLCVKVGSSDLRAYERVYNADGDVTEVHVSGQPTWRYDYDADANIVRASHHDNQRTFVVDAGTTL